MQTMVTGSSNSAAFFVNQMRSSLRKCTQNRAQQGGTTFYSRCGEHKGVVSGEEPGHCLTVAPSPGSGSESAQAWEWGCFLSLSYTKVNNRIVVVKVKQPSPCCCPGLSGWQMKETLVPSSLLSWVLSKWYRRRLKGSLCHRMLLW